MNIRTCLSLIVATILGSLSAACRLPSASATTTPTEPPAPASRPIAVEVFTVGPGDPVSKLLIPAVLSVEGLASILARRDGTVIWIGGEEGSLVTRGQVIARLEDDSTRAALRQTDLDVGRFRVEDGQAEAQVRINRTELDRQRALADDGLISKRDLELAQHKLESSRQDQEKARLATQIAIARVQAAQTEAEHAIIRAPFAGQITRRLVRLGASVLKGEQLFEISQLGPLEVKFQAPPIERAHIEATSLLDLSLPDGTQLARAKVRRVAPVIDAATNSLTFVADVIGGGKLSAGLAVYVQVPRSESSRTLWLPRSVFVLESKPAAGRSSVVFVVKNGTCMARTVAVAVEEGDLIGVISGIEVNEQVVLAPGPELRDGDAVEVINQTPLRY